MPSIPVFDGHNDVLLRLWRHYGDHPERAFIDGTPDGHLDLPRARQGGFVGGLFAIFPPSPGSMSPPPVPDGKGFDSPLPPNLPLPEGQEATFAMASILVRIEKASGGQVAICRNRAQIDAAIARGSLATVMHIEGADGIDIDLHALTILYEAGLRSIGPVWSRPNAFGHGVPFRFPGTPDTGPGLTDAGKRLVKACNELGVMIDLSHMNEQGFWDVAELSDAPLVATHSNVHALCPSTRNLTDRQLAAIAETGGMVGLNYATGFLRPDGQMLADTRLDLMREHLDYLIARLGEDHVGLGSDFDGATIPDAIGTVAGLPKLVEHLSRNGYPEPLLRKICKDNWLNLLETTIG